MVRRARWLRAHPLCAHCLLVGFFTRGVEVDHVQALTHGGADDDSNLQTLCRDCHEDKTRRDLNYRERVAVGVDGWPLGGGFVEKSSHRADSAGGSLFPKNGDPTRAAPARDRRGMA